MTSDTTPDNTPEETPDLTAAIAPAPLETLPIDWSTLPLSEEMLKIIVDCGYKHPSPVQAQAIPMILEKNDVLVSSQTGSGKTAAFVIPTIENFKNKNGTYILALSPTREIAQQTGAVFETFGKPFGLKTVVCIGGASIPVEKEALSSSPHIIVATPGRLVDHLERGNVWLDFIQCLIFDEADRMLDMGFANQIEKITDHLPKERQTLMFSATFDPKVEKLARNVMREPKEVKISKEEGSVPKIEQRLMWMDEGRKASTLARVVRDEPGTVIIFAKSKERVFQVWRTLLDRKIEATYIHSDIPQDQREAAVAEFKDGKYRVLVATDVMGRGIDVDDVAHVINYDVPREAEDYIHRIGRTGRRGKTGMATTFAIPGKDDREIRAIEKLRGIENSENRPEPRDESRDDSRSRSGSRDSRDGRGQRPGPSRGDRPQHRGPRADGPRGPRPQGQQRPDGSRDGGPRDGGPRDGGSRDGGPRDGGPRDGAPRGDRPRHNGPRRDQAPRRDHAQAEQKPKPQAVVSAKKDIAGATEKKGILGWFKKLLG